jgi:hypothetical protein
MLSRIMFIVTAIASCIVSTTLSASELVLAEGGKSDYRIVVADGASPSTRHGAEELQAFLEQMTGAKLPIVCDNDKLPISPHEIILGDNKHLRAIGANIDCKSLGSEGYVIRTVGERLVIAGGALRGDMYGVYGFLEDHLGCRWFAPGVSRIPKSPRLAIGAINERQVPVLEYREPFVEECFDGDWAARNRMNSGCARLEAKHGGKMQIASLAHSFNFLVPPDKYFKEHPEYFSLVGGRRTDGYSQLCCTNPDVIRLCSEGVREWMRGHPECTVFSVSQNDCFNYCECAKCQEVAKQEDSQMGPVLRLVNHVAKAVEKEFPDKIVQTIAYQWTRHPPKLTRPRPNVVIMLCSIECCFAHPLATCDCEANKAFRADMEAWSKIAPRLWVWDYTTDFAEYMLPFPNHRNLGSNVRYFVAHNVKGIFEEDTYDTPQGELSCLDGYVMAKCLWNPNYDAEKAIDEFLAGYYGKAAGPIRQYIDLLYDYAKRTNVHVGEGVPTGHPHLSDELLIAADRLWQQAEGLVAAEPEVLQRVKLSRMSVDYAIVERARLQAQKQLPANGPFVALAKTRFQPFLATLLQSKVVRLHEGAPLDKEAYRQGLAADLKIKL